MTNNKLPKNLYIDMDGVLVSLSNNAVITYPSLVPDALDFIYFANKYFKCHWLTCWPEAEIYKEFPNLPRFDYCHWKHEKTQAIDFTESFIWLEDGCQPRERLVLKKNKKLDSYYYIDPEDDYALTKWMDTIKKEYNLKYP